MPSPLKFLTADDECLLRNAGTALRYSPGDTLIRAGSHVHTVIVLWGGQVRLELNDRSGDEALASIKPLHIFGENALLGDEQAPVSVVAQDEVQAYVIDAQVMFELIGSNPAFATRLFRSLASALSERLNRVAVLAAPAFSPE